MSTTSRLLANLPTIPPATELRSSNVLVIEWLGDNDRKTGTELHDWMSERRDGWSQIRRCRSKQDVLSAIAEATERARTIGYIPVLHFEAHGHQLGLEGPDGIGGLEHLLWVDLNEALCELNVATAFNLVVFIAACEGFAAIRSLCVGQALPTIMLAGPTTVVLPGELLALTKEFYRGWQRLEASATDIGDSAARELVQGQFDWEPSARLLYEGFVQALLLRGQSYRLAPLAAVLQSEWNSLVGIDRFPANTSRFGLDVPALCNAIDAHYSAGGRHVPNLF